jgi:hypothetical protein
LREAFTRTSEVRSSSPKSVRTTARSMRK